MEGIEGRASVRLAAPLCRGSSVDTHRDDLADQLLVGNAPDGERRIAAANDAPGISKRARVQQ
ncbi:hypothetical protein AIZ04_25635, partial [Salmonella enterica subsp. enterica serovar Typhimurium]